MAEILSPQIGLSTPVDNGSKVFGALAQDGEHICYELTAPDGTVTRFALSHEVLDAMMDVACELLKRSTGSTGTAGVTWHCTRGCPAFEVCQAIKGRGGECGATRGVSGTRGETFPRQPPMDTADRE